MKNYIRRMFALMVGVLVASAGFGANLQWLVSGCDLYEAVQNMPAANDGFQLHMTSGELTFTLSDDATIENLTIDPRTETIINLDFARDGDNTLSLTKSLSLNPNSNGHINFIGGVYDLSFGTSLNRPTSNATATFDGVQFTMPYCYLVDGVKNSTVTFTNGATVTVPKSTASLDPRLYVFSGSGLSGARLVVSGGSKLVASGGNEIFYEYLNNRTGETLASGSASALFTGEGTELKVTDAKRLRIGYGLGGIETTFADHATASAGSTDIGCSANVSNTKVTFTDNAVFSAGSSLGIGTVANADGNVLTISDGATLTTSGALTLGTASCHNRLTVSNAAMTVNSLVIGSEATASDNVCRICGTEAVFTVNGDPSKTYDPFSAGQGNRLVFDGTDLTLGHAIGLCHVGANELALENAAQVTGGVTILPGAENVTLSIGAGSTLKPTGQFYVAGTNNTLVISNGTLQAYTATPYAFYFGRDIGGSKPCRNNKIVFQGDNPQITSDQDAPTMAITAGSVIRFELPTTPYQRVPLYGAVSCSADCTIEIAGIEALQHAQVPKHADYVLAQSRNGANIGLNADVVAAASATLPDGCSLTLKGDRLVLHVKAIRDTGLLLLVR